MRLRSTLKVKNPDAPGRYGERPKRIGGGPVMTKDESEAFYQMLEALMSARRYILAQQYYPPEFLVEIDAAIRHAEAEQRGHLTGEN
jgi:hypothetical protein